MPVRAALYARLSDDRDADKLGIDTQLGDGRAIAERKGWTVVGEYVDRSLSASKKLVNRPEYNRLVDDFNAGTFDALICWDLDRLTRQPRQLEDWIDAAEERGLMIVTANGEADLSTSNGIMFARMKATIGKNESDRTSQRVKRNVQARRDAGKWHGGTVPYGYTAVDSQLKPRDDEVERITEAMKRLLAGDTMYGIASDWNSRGLMTRTGKAWRQSNLRPILLNRTNLGETKSGTVGWTPIVERVTFDRVERLLTDPSRRVTKSPGVRGGKYSMGGGVSVCAECGFRLITDTKRGRTRLACLSRVSSTVTDPTTGEVLVPGACGHVAIDHERLEEYVFTEVVRALEANPRWGQVLAERDPSADARIEALQSKRTDLEEQRQRVTMEYVRGLIPQRELDQIRATIEAEADQLQREIDSLLGTSIMSDALADGLDWRAWSPMRRRNFLKIAIARVEVDRYPTGMARNLPKRSNETAAENAARRADLVQTVMEQRVKIVPRGA
ncbi:hypothetical protein A4X17_05990 [Plantibacter sp. H53]|uniref:recombinase family protein n=1 Tax=Plantibacter sp. H53 TaxID=1827323 RepID=UPI0007D8FCA5|nr:recombinase family protein [Plantibacter sp. H53]OAN29124.1 hypothetical protein A4X17_05990 [Plantibacter sp. H53]